MKRQIEQNKAETPKETESGEKVDIPTCLGYKDEFNGDFDCEYDATWFCEDCLCNYEIGGWMDPRTPEAYKDKI